MEEREVPKKYPFALEWTPELVGDFKREIFDEYFHGDFSVEQWQKVLQEGKRCVGMQIVERRETPKSGRGTALNKSECGRLCYFLQLMPKEFNSIFKIEKKISTKPGISSSHIPSSVEDFCIQPNREKRSNVYATVEEIFSRHSIPIFYPKMTAEDLRKAKEKHAREREEQVSRLQREMDRLIARDALYASFCDKGALYLEEEEKADERAENSPESAQSEPPTTKAEEQVQNSPQPKPHSDAQPAEYGQPKAEGAEPFQTSLF